MAEEAGVDLVTYSPVFPSFGKPGYGPVAGASGLRDAVRSTDLPVFALGGVTPERTAVCRKAGAAGIAAMSGILAAHDVSSAVKAYAEAWANG